jgi:signal transduction histidine kinase
VQRSGIDRLALLSDASRMLAETSLEYAATLEALAKIVVPRLADDCVVFVVETSGSITRVTEASVSAENAEALRKIREHPPTMGASNTVLQTVRSGKTVFVDTVDEHMLANLAGSTEHAAALRAVHPRTFITVPLFGRGHVIGAFTFGMSVSDRTYTQEDVELAEELGRRAGMALENARLFRDNQQLVKELQQAVQVRDDFLAAAGHELKTPLAALLMHVDSMHRMLGKNIIPSNLFQRLDKASKSGTRLARLIDELLDVSRITAGRLHLEPETVQLDELVRDVVDRFTESQVCSITLTAEPVAGTWDRARIDQVVSNLIENALKYGEGKPIEVCVGPKSGGALIRVVDHGIGVAAEEQAKIFERFERAVENREFGGFGLGLWIARQIVESSGGKIEVVSAPGQGATFTVTLT